MPVRIYDIAKKLGIESRDVLKHAKTLGISAAKVPSSSLDKITAEYLEQELGEVGTYIPDLREIINRLWPAVELERFRLLCRLYESCEIGRYVSITYLTYQTTEQWVRILVSAMDQRKESPLSISGWLKVLVAAGCLNPKIKEHRQWYQEYRQCALRNGVEIDSDPSFDEPHEETGQQQTAAGDITFPAPVVIESKGRAIDPIEAVKENEAKSNGIESPVQRDEGPFQAEPKSQHTVQGGAKSASQSGRSPVNVKMGWKQRKMLVQKRRHR